MEVILLIGRIVSCSSAPNLLHRARTLIGGALRRMLLARVGIKSTYKLPVAPSPPKATDSGPRKPSMKPLI